MVRLRPVRSVRMLTFEEQTRVANLFMLLIEVNQQKGVTQKRRSPQPSHKIVSQSSPASAGRPKSASKSSRKIVGQSSPTKKNKEAAQSESQCAEQIHAEQTSLSRVRKARSRPTNSRRDLFLKHKLPHYTAFNVDQSMIIGNL